MAEGFPPAMASRADRALASVLAESLIECSIKSEPWVFFHKERLRGKVSSFAAIFAVVCVGIFCCVVSQWRRLLLQLQVVEKWGQHSPVSDQGNVSFAGGTHGTLPHFWE